MKRLSNILCPVDFTEGSYDAIEKASFLAGLYQADLTLVHVLSVMPQSFGIVYGLDQDMQSLVEKAEESARTLLREAKRKYVPYVINCRSSIGKGNVAGEIVRAAQANKSDLILMAAEGGSAYDPIKLGSKVSDIIRSSPCPVLSYYKVSAFHGFKHILIPVDPQFGVGEIRRYVRDYLSLMVPKVCLITVVDPDLPEADRVPVQEFLDQEICQFQDEGVENVSGSLVEGENIADRLTRYGTDNGCDLIMMYTHGRSGLGSMSLSSVTHNVVNHSRLPVFTMRPEMELSQD